jgi:hypothetical protein
MKTIQLPQSARYNDNVERYGEHDDTCICCGKRISNVTFHVHMNTDWKIKPVEDSSEQDSQGFFPVGPECAKKIQFGYLHQNI